MSKASFSMLHSSRQPESDYTDSLISPPSTGAQVPVSIATAGTTLPAIPAGEGYSRQQGFDIGYGRGQGFDTTGQIQPPGKKPRVTATLLEDEGSLCFQVEAKGACVARRGDNRMINGTKLLNVTGMTRGRRDGILKSEKTRHIVMIGPMHLKGVWIPFERALDLANKEKITELLWPLFVHDIGALLHHPTNQTRSNVVAVVGRRKLEQKKLQNTQALELPPSHQHHHHSISISAYASHRVGFPQHSSPSHPSFDLRAARDEVNRQGVKEHFADSVNATATTRITDLNTGGEVMSHSSSQDSIGAQYQRATHSSQSNSYDQTESVKMFPAVSKKSTQILSAREDDVGRSNSPDDPVSYTPTEQIKGHVFNSFPNPVEKDISRDHTLHRTDSDVVLASLQPLCASKCDKKFHGMDDIKKIVLDCLQGDESVGESSSTARQKPSQKRRKIYSAVHKSATLCEYATSSTPEVKVYKARFYVYWNIPEFMSRQFGRRGESFLGTVIAFTGTARYAQATTVGEYLRTYWPDTCTTLLDTLQKALDHGRTSIISKDGKLKIQVVPSGARVWINGSDQDVVEIAQQLTWLGSALDTSKTESVGRSRAHICRGLNVVKTSFDINFFTDSMPEEETSCWHSLVVNPLIVYNFPIASRAEELGLEIPIHMMAALGGASHAIEYEGGLLLKGFSSMFVPLRRSGDSVQWHFIKNKHDDRLEYWQARERCPGRALLDAVDQKSLTSTRAFVGWWTNTTTHLGTKDANYDNIDWSATKEPNRSTTFSGGSIGFQNFGAGELSFSVGPKDSKLHISRTGPYERIIKHASKTPVVLYDTEERRAWLVPGSAVIAHVAKTRHSREPFVRDGKPIDISPVDQHHNVYAAAERMLTDNASTELISSASGCSGFYFRDLVLGTWSLLERLMDQDIKKEVSADPAVHATTRKCLRGWEFMDLVDERSPIRQKETYLQKSCGDWVNLVRDINAVVLFASGFEDIIQPDQGSITGLCHKWKRVPNAMDYLTASVPMLNALYEKAGSRLTKMHLTSTHLQWHRGPKLFENCNNTQNFRCDCDRVQNIVSDSRMTLGRVEPPGSLEQHMEGAVIFGQTKSAFMTTISTQASARKDGIYSQANVTLMVPNNRFPDSVSSSSSSIHDSPLPPILDLATTTQSSVESEDEDNNVSSVTTKEMAIDTDRSLKRSRNIDEESPQDKRDSHGYRLTPPKQVDAPQIDKGRLLEEETTISPQGKISSSDYQVFECGNWKAKPSLHRKRGFHYQGQKLEASGPREGGFEERVDYDRLPVRSRVKQRKRTLTARQ